MFSHIMVGSNDIARSKTFYDAVLGALGAKPAITDDKGRLIYMHDGGVFLVTTPINGQPATPANGGTIGFACAAQAHIHPDLAEFVREPADEIRIKVRRHPLTTLENRDRRVRTRGNVGEFRGYIAAADQHDALGQLVHGQEVFISVFVAFLLVCGELGSIRSRAEARGSSCA